LKLMKWAARFDGPRRWGVEDCRHVAGRLIDDLIRAGEQVVMVPPKLMARCRASARTRGKSDPIDALAVARAVLREPDLPVAVLDRQSLDVRLLLNHREDLVAERTRRINRLCWHLVDLDSDLEPPTKTLNRLVTLRRLAAQLAELPGSARRDIAIELVERILADTVRINELEREIIALVSPLAPALLALPGVAGLTAAKLIGEVAGIDRFRTSAAAGAPGRDRVHPGVDRQPRKAPAQSWRESPAQRRVAPHRSHPDTDPSTRARAVRPPPQPARRHQGRSFASAQTTSRRRRVPRHERRAPPPPDHVPDRATPRCLT
jgi:transposase